MNRKAAIQLSLGFIVAVVFAVILLSLSLTWVQQMFVPISTITHKTTDIAMQRLLQELASTNKKVGIAAPAVTAWAKGETGSYALGIKNEDADTSNTYYINIYLEEVGGDLAKTPVASLSNEVKEWISYSKAIDLDPLERDIVDIVIKPTVTAPPGIYHFRAAVCKDYDPECHATSPPLYTTPSASLYGSTSFAIEIKG
ncbi:MAG: hypothetical protein DRP27_10080 [Thermotogae bacterium]|nr:MAG: hypothetical protein DRP27_10080 [Thermotogota bacterium]